ADHQARAARDEGGRRGPPRPHREPGGPGDPRPGIRLLRQQAGRAAPCHHGRQRGPRHRHHRELRRSHHHRHPGQPERDAGRRPRVLAQDPRRRAGVPVPRLPCGTPRHRCIGPGLGRGRRAHVIMGWVHTQRQQAHDHEPGRAQGTLAPSATSVSACSAPSTPPGPPSPGPPGPPGSPAPARPAGATRRVPPAEALVIPPPPVSRAAIPTRITVSSKTNVTTTLTSGSCWPSRIAPKIHSGSVFCAPAVKVVTMTSSNDSANASRAPEITAVDITGIVTVRNVKNPCAPRSAAASYSAPEVLPSRPSSLLYLTPMQNVACPMMIVNSDSPIPLKLNAEFSAIPVMIPGSESGSTSSSETASRPKNRNRCTPNAAAEPSRSATAVANSPALSDSTNAARTCGSCQATGNHFRLSPWIGQLCTLDELNA